jgi:phospholipid/cholesterol/gamma-HCH transport system substrate-binding protein
MTGRAKRIVAATAVGLAAVLAAGFTLFHLVLGGDSYTITARFRATPGLYAGNRVDILGVPKGTITALTPTAHYVDVVISLPTDVKVPADAKAVLMAPNPVSDRFLELTPPYTGGPSLGNGAVIDLPDTAVPLELDSIYASVDDLSTALGPRGANAHGELSAVLHSLARLADGNGRNLHQVIDRLAAALPALTEHPGALAALITGLDRLTGRLAARNGTINALYGDLASATGRLADERATIAAAVSNLQRGLAEVASFLKSNQAHIGSSVRNLNTTLAAVMSEQKALIQTFDTAPLGFQNFNRAIDLNSPCLTATGAPNNCAALWSRVDTTSDAGLLVKTYCGNEGDNLFAIILTDLGLRHDATATHTACGAEVGLFQKRPGAPGSPRTPDFDLTHYLGS